MHTHCTQYYVGHTCTTQRKCNSISSTKQDSCRGLNFTKPRRNESRQFRAPQQFYPPRRKEGTIVADNIRGALVENGRCYDIPWISILVFSLFSCENNPWLRVILQVFYKGGLEGEGCLTSVIKILVIVRINMYIVNSMLSYILYTYCRSQTASQTVSPGFCPSVLVCFSTSNSWLWKETTETTSSTRDFCTLVAKWARWKVWKILPKEIDQVKGLIGICKDLGPNMKSMRGFFSRIQWCNLCPCCPCFPRPDFGGSRCRQEHGHNRPL